jgi:hypothetical protein
MSYTNKTQPTAISPEKYLAMKYAGKERLRNEAMALIDVYSKVTGWPCVMWNKIFGFGTYQYLDSKGGEHTFLVTGFAISSTGFTLYNMIGWSTFAADLKKLGKHKLSGKSCLAIKSIADIDVKVLTSIIKRSVAEMKKKYRTE